MLQLIEKLELVLTHQKKKGRKEKKIEGNVKYQVAELRKRSIFKKRRT